MHRLLLLTLLGCGCDVLFPELAGSPPDLGTAADAAVDLSHGTPDGAGTTMLAGVTCAPADPRDLTTCQSVALAGLRVSVEETGDHADVDATGRFQLALARPLTTATLRTSDVTGTFAPTLTAVTPSTGLAVPLYRGADLLQIALRNGFPLDNSRALLFAYAVDAAAHPIAGASIGAPPGASGPLYDGPTVGDVQLGSATGAHGLLALYNVPVPTGASLKLPVATSAASPVAADQFILPIAAGAVTFSLLVLPSK